MQKTALRQLRERNAARQEFSLHRFIRRDQNHAVAIGDRDFINVDGVFRGLELRAQALVDLESLPNIFVNGFGAVRDGPQAFVRGVGERALCLLECLVCDFLRALVGLLEDLREQLGDEDARQNDDDEQHQPGHHQSEFSAQP